MRCRISTNFSERAATILTSSRARLVRMKALDRENLDVVNQTRSNLFRWRAQFPPEFVG